MNQQDRLRARLEPYYSSELTLAEMADSILALDRRWRIFVLDWVVSIAKTDTEVARRFARQASFALHSLGREGCEAWLQAALDAYFETGREAAIVALNELDQFIAAQRKRSRGLAFGSVSKVLQLFLQGLEGRPLALKTSDLILTDSETLYLPEIIDLYPATEENFACYRACAVHQWAQCWYGTWRADSIAKIPRREPMLATFHYLETLRLNACLARDFPGLARGMQALTPTPEIWRPLALELQDPAATVLDSIRLSSDHWDKPRPARFAFQGILDPDRVQAVLEARLEREQQQIRLARARHAEEQSRAAMRQTPENDPEIRRLETSIRQDLGELPPACLEAASPIEYRRYLDAQQAERDEADASLTYDSFAAGTYLYDEWDYTRRAHRKRWCALRETEIEPDYESDFVGETLTRYRGQIRSLRRSFEALRDEYRILKKQPDGENLDIDALVEAIADSRSGMELSSRIYRKSRRAARDIAVVFMVDMSGSMKGWLNQVQREALILLAEALQNLNDRYAIYGFSGNTRKRCELYRIKTFDEAYDLEVRARIAAIEPQHFTRMGVTIRHLNRMLDGLNAKTKLLITLSDGRPYDYDNYDDEYAIEDTRMALYEARQLGIHPFCITIDEQARDYLPHMYGESGYVLINDVGKLPYRISEVYRSLTS